MGKKFVSLMLTLAVALSLAVPALAEEAPQDADGESIIFTDAAQIEHWEAVASLAQLGMIAGKDDGAFHPTDTLTRAEAAKFIVTIVVGPNITPERLMENLEDYPGNFSDIQGHWAEAYIKQCDKSAFIVGRGDGTFDPDGQVTGLELLKMALVSLGYEAKEYQLLGDSWAEQTDRVARSTRPSLYEGLIGVNITQPITRDNAAQILYNALQVTPKVATGRYTDDNGQNRWILEDDVRGDGTPVTLLYQMFGLDAFPDIPAQPTES